MNLHVQYALNNSSANRVAVGIKASDRVVNNEILIMPILFQNKAFEGRFRRKNGLRRNLTCRQMWHVEIYSLGKRGENETCHSKSSPDLILNHALYQMTPNDKVIM